VPAPSGIFQSTSMKTPSCFSPMIVLVITGLAFSGSLPAQDTVSPPATPVSQPAQQDERPVSLGKLIPNILEDQPKIWLFPTKLTKKRNWIPVAVILGTTAALIAADPHDAPYFRKTSTFSGFNSVFTSTATEVATAVVPLSMYAGGLIARDSKMKNTALLAGEAVADSEILEYVLKVAFKRVRPSSIPPGGNYSDTFFESPGSLFRGNGSMPSGHTIAAFSVATIVARRYGNHKWVPWVSYGLAAAVGFSRVTLSAHFVSDVFVGGALGYSVSRFAVLQQ
jgi:membrane-associated phospholipid phosphatase